MYFLLHKSWIWWTLGHVMSIFSYCHFHNASNECFWPKKISNLIHRFKSAILAIFQFCQNGTFEPVHEIRFFLAKSILLKHYENGKKKKYLKHIPESAKSRIYSGKSTKRGFSKKALSKIEIFVFVLGSYESLKHMEG